KGEVGIEFHTLWEKVATFFVINNEHEALFKFFNKTRLAINNIELKDDKESDMEEKLRSDLFDYLKVSIAIPIAYNLGFDLYKISKFNSSDIEILNLAKKFRQANLFRNTWISIPALNFTKYLSSNDFNFNLF